MNNAESAESTLAEAVEIMRPFAHDDLCRLASGNIYGNVSVVFARGDAELTIGDFTAARDFITAQEKEKGK